MRILLALWPPALVYLIFQRYFIQGLVASGLKG
jgi:ABC-type glycerol-3-phosphate transport system permease component